MLATNMINTNKNDCSCSEERDMDDIYIYIYDGFTVWDSIEAIENYD